MPPKQYTKDELISQLHRFFNENNAPPKHKNLGTKNGYPSACTYTKYFGSLEQAIKIAGLKSKKDIFEEFLLSELRRFKYINGRSPTTFDFNNKNGYPAFNSYFNHFSTWNNALIMAGLEINQIQTILTGDEVCDICNKDTNNRLWSIVDGKRICSKCACSKRTYMHGILDINSSLGMGVIAETVVYIVLKDAIKCNTDDNFCGPYDLISDKYGTINVKSAILKPIRKNYYNSTKWAFCYKPKQRIVDNCICIGFNNNRTSIQHVWIIPKIANIYNKSSIFIPNSLKGLSNVEQYEVDATPYNEVYQNLDIYTLPEFCNLNKPEEMLV